eukprot:4804615-Pyramimonas_sp.AAC.1
MDRTSRDEKARARAGDMIQVGARVGEVAGGRLPRKEPTEQSAQARTLASRTKPERTWRLVSSAARAPSPRTAAG